MIIMNLKSLFCRYRWDVLKSLEFLNFKKPDVEFTASVLRSLNDYEKLMKKDDIQFLSSDWSTYCK